MADDINQLGDAASGFSDTMNNVGKITSDLINMFSNFGDKASNAFKGMSDGAKTAQTATEGANGAASGLLDTLIAANGFFSKSTLFSTAFGDKARDQFLSVSSAVDTLKSNMGLLDKVPGVDKMLKYAEGIGSVATQGQLAEAGFYAMTSAAGQLNKAWGDGGFQIESLGTKTSDYMKTLSDLAIVNRTTTDRTLELAKSMSEIPNIRDAMVNITGSDSLPKSLDSITAVMRIATGAGRDQKDVLDALSVAYEDLGNAQDGTVETGQRGINLFSTMVELQQKLGIRFEDSRKALTSVAEEFKNVGDETDSAAKIFDTFGKALQNTGISAKASIGIVSDMIKGIGALTVGTKAFISAQSGGAGGLQGSLQIDEMLRKHDLAGVMNAAQTALKKQLGGRIYTQEEGAQSQTAAAGYIRQRQLVQSGVFGIGKGADDQTAGRILEALKQGDVSGLKDTIKSGQEAAGDLAEKGDKLQERNYTQLTRIAQLAQRQAIAAELMAASELRKTFGTESPSQKMVDSLHKTYEAATSQLMQKETPVDDMGKRAEMPKGFSDSLKNLRGKPSEEFTSGFEGLGESLVAAKDRLAGDKAPKQQTSKAPVVPLHMYSDQHKQAIYTNAAENSRTAQADRQIKTASEVIKQPSKEEQTVKVMIDINDPHGNVGKVSTPAPYTVSRKGNVSPVQTSTANSGQ